MLYKWAVFGKKDDTIHEDCQNAPLMVNPAGSPDLFCFAAPSVQEKMRHRTSERTSEIRETPETSVN
jgi:hypothetical protein